MNRKPAFYRAFFLRALLSLTLAVVATGCGKDPNKHQAVLLDFPSILPERPVALASPVAEPWASGRALAVHGDDLFAVDTLNGELVIIDRHTMDIQRRVSVGVRPEQVVVSPEGVAFVSVRGDGEVVRIESGASEVSLRMAVGTEPIGLALGVSGTTDALFVSLSGDARVLALNPLSLIQRDQVTTLEDPRGLALSFKGFLIVTHSRDNPLKIAITDEGMFAASEERNLRPGNPTDHFFLPGRLQGLHPTRSLAATINPATGDGLIAHVQASPGTPEELFNRPEVGDTGAVNNSGYGSASRTVDFNIPVRPIETSVTLVGSTDDTPKVVSSPPVQDPLSGEPMLHLVDSPSDINHHPTHSLAFITGEGSDNVLVINTRGIDPLSSPLAEIKVGMAPKSVAFSSDGQKAYVLNGHSFTVSEIDVTPFFNLPTIAGGQGVQVSDFDDEEMSSFAQPPAPDMEEEEGGAPQTHVTTHHQELSDDVTLPITLLASRERTFGEDPRSEELRQGDRVFTFARNDGISHAGMFSCATCHLEGREDKLTWIVPEGLRQTPSLAGRLAGTAPFNWNGDNDVLQNNMTQTISRLGGGGLSTDQLDHLEKFMLSGLQVPRNPHLADGGLTEIQAAGKVLFEDVEVGCTGCHAGEALVDGLPHDVGTTSEFELEVAAFREKQGGLPNTGPQKYDTPTLKGLWYTGPYLHDGSATTLLEILNRTGDRMGKTSHLSADDKEALVAYLLTL